MPRPFVALALLLVGCSPASASDVVDVPQSIDTTTLDTSSDVASDRVCVACTDPRCRGCAGDCCLVFDDASTPPDATTVDAASDGARNDVVFCEVDRDGDGYGSGRGCLDFDCNDDDATIHPNAPERCDAIDSNCDGVVDAALSTDLNAWCSRTAPALPSGCMGMFGTLCRHADDFYSRGGLVPFNGPMCIQGRVCGSDPTLLTTCWRMPGVSVPCAM